MYLPYHYTNQAIYLKTILMYSKHIKIINVAYSSGVQEYFNIKTD